MQNGNEESMFTHTKLRLEMNLNNENKEYSSITEATGNEQSRREEKLSKFKKLSFDYLKFSEKGYFFEGEDTYTFGGITTTQMISNKIGETKGSDLYVLDIGTGNGSLPSFLRKQYGVQAFGISGPTRHAIPDHVKIMDAHQFSESAFFKPILFDFIFSRHTFEHLTDSIQVLKKAYDKLKIGGMLVVSELELSNLTRQQLTEIFCYMKTKGYSISWCPRFVKDYTGSLFIQKTIDKPALSIPLEVSGIHPVEMRAMYQTTFKEDSLHIEQLKDQTEAQFNADLIKMGLIGPISSTSSLTAKYRR